MPTYQYKCTACGFEFEEFQGINDDPVSRCPKCGQKPRRLITGGAGFLLKGNGFYTTDYRSEAYKTAARKDSPTVDASPKTETKKTEKPKTETKKT